jgi:hypothetical protein
MKHYLISSFAFIALFAAQPALQAGPNESSRVAGELVSLNSEQVLARIQEGSWLRLPALSEVTGEENRSVETVANAVLKALAHEARNLPNLTDATTLLDRTLRMASVSKIAASKGGYLNDIIATSADQVFLLGAWTVIDRTPNLAPKLRSAIEARGKLPTPKAWFMERYEIDPALVAKKGALDAMKPDATGFQAVVPLQKTGRDASNLPTVFDQITAPDIALLWWTVYTTDYRMVVLQAGIAYVEGGGKFSQNVNDFRAACASIFDTKRLPFTHELKRGSIYPEDIWDNWNAARDASVYQRQIQQWFGKP